MNEIRLFVVETEYSLPVREIRWVQCTVDFLRRLMNEIRQFFLFYWTNYVWLLVHIVGWSTNVLCWKLKQECSWNVVINGTERRFFYCKVYVERAMGWLPEGETEEEWDKSRVFPSANLPPFFWAGLIKRPLNSRNMTKKSGFSLQRIIWFTVANTWNMYAI